MSRSRRTISLISLLLLMALALAACGGTPTGTTSQATSAAPDEAEPVDEVAPTEVQTEAPVEEVTAAAPAATEAETAAAPTTEEETAAPAATEAGADTGASSSSASGTLRVAITTQPNSLDVPATAEINAGMVAAHLYDSLVWVNDEGEVEPALATSWEVSEDGLEYTFELREGVTFHNGEPFNADSVILSWERGSRPEMEFGDRWTIVKTIEKIDDGTVKMTLEAPNPLLLRIMASNWAMVPPQYIKEVGEEGFNAKPVGTGPFMFVEWIKEDRVVFKANPNYWREGIPKVENLIFRPIPESSTRVAAIETGEVDIVTRLSAEEAQQLEGVEGVEVIRYPVDRVYYIAFNNLTSGKGQPTEDPKVRQALNYAVDRQAIIDSLFGGAARLSTGFLTPGNLGYNEEIEPYPYDPDRARELLAEAGYPDGFEMGMACPIGAYTNFEQVCEAVEGYLAEVGVTTNLELMESAQYWDLEGKKELPPLFGDSWSESSGEAYPRLRGALAGNDASFSAWSEPTIDDYLAKISSTIDDDERAQLYSELHQYMYDNPPFIYLYEPETFEAISTRVENYNPRSNEMKYLWETTISESE